MEEQSDKHPLMSSLKDMLGIDDEDLKDEPQIASFFKISQGTNLGSYKILEFKRNSEGKITHALVVPMYMDKIYGGKEGSMKRLPRGAADHGVKLVAVQDLDKLMGQDFSATQQQMP